MDLTIQQSSQAKRRRLAPHGLEESSPLPFRIVVLAAGIFAYCPIAEWGRMSSVNRASHCAIRRAMAARARALGVGPRGESLDRHCAHLQALWSQLPTFLSALPDATQHDAGIRGHDREEALRRLRALPPAQLVSILRALPSDLSSVEHVKTSLLASCHAQGIDLALLEKALGKSLPPLLNPQALSPARQHLNPFNIRDLAQHIFSYCSVQQWGRSTSLSKTVHTAIRLEMVVRARSVGIALPRETLDVQCARFRLLWLQIPLLLSRIATNDDPGVASNDRWSALQELRALPLPRLLQLLRRTSSSLENHYQLNDVKHVESVLLSVPHTGEADPSLLQWLWAWRGMRAAGNKRAEEVGRFLLDHGLFKGMSREQIQKWICVDHVASPRLIRLLLDRGCIGVNMWVHRRPMRHKTIPLLHAAVGLDALATVKLLLQRGADPNLTNEAGESALFYVRPGHKNAGEIVNLLIKASISIERAVDNKLLHVLLKAHHYRPERTIDVSPIEALLWRGANPNIETPQGRTALFFFPYEPYLSLFKTYGATINHRDHKGRTPLAIQAGDLWKRDATGTDASEVRVDFMGMNAYNFMGMDAYNNRIWFEDTYNSIILFDEAAEGSQVLDLLRCGADPNIADHEGNTPLFFARENETVEHLLNYRADVNRINNLGMSVLHYHVGQWSQRTEHIRTLLDRGARCNVDVFDQQGLTPLHKALWHKQFAYAHELVFYSNPNIPTLKEGFTPLHLAVKQRASYLVQRLLGYGADPSQTDGAGRTPLDLVYIRPRGRRNQSHISEEEKIIALLKPHKVVAQPPTVEQVPTAAQPPN